MKKKFPQKNTCKRSIVFLLLIALSFTGNAQSLSEKVAATAMKTWPDTSKSAVDNASFNQSFLLEGLAAVWKRTANADYYRYIQQNIDNWISQNGTIKSDTQDNYPIKIGSALLLLYRVTGQEKYYKALQQLRERLKNQPKKINQMQPNDWFSIEQFYAEYAAVFDEPAAFDEIANGFISPEKLILNPTTFKANAMGLYGMALVDVLEYFPENHPQRKALLAILNRFAAAFQFNQNLENGMLVYTLAKGRRLGYLPEKYKNSAKKGYDAMVKNEAAGNIKDPKNAGVFILAANEMELAEIPQTGKGQTVMLDSYLNNEFMKDVSGRTIPFHYKWNEMDNNGFYFFKNAFNYHGVKTETLNAAPTTANLKGSNIYLIVDPDTQKETEKPNYVNQETATVIAAWVKAGGVLVLMGNDAGNCDLEHFNILAEKFGIRFNEDIYNKVIGSQIKLGTLQVPPPDPIFKTAKQIYLKDISTFKLNPPAVASFADKKTVLIATAKFGKGAVFAVGDPWFYDEYTDGRNLPASYDNFKACNDLVNWLVKQVPGKN